MRLTVSQLKKIIKETIKESIKEGEDRFGFGGMEPVKNHDAFDKKVLLFQKHLDAFRKSRPNDGYGNPTKFDIEGGLMNFHYPAWEFSETLYGYDYKQSKRGLDAMERVLKRIKDYILTKPPYKYSAQKDVEPVEKIIEMAKLLMKERFGDAKEATPREFPGSKKETFESIKRKF